MKIYFSLIFLLLTTGICSAQGEIFFTKEDLTFEIKDSIFKVEGIYYFDSNSDHKFNILYPFPSDSIYGKAFNIKVSYVNTNQLINYRMAKDSSSIAFQIFGNKDQPVFISYSQKLKTGRVKYILTTTKQWGKPLGEVNYKLITALDFDIKRFSIIPDKEIQLEGEKIYLWSREGFLPGTDFEIEF